jgi:hypothetical protein
MLFRYSQQFIERLKTMTSKAAAEKLLKSLYIKLESVSRVGQENYTVNTPENVELVLTFVQEQLAKQ